MDMKEVTVSEYRQCVVSEGGRDRVKCSNTEKKVVFEEPTFKGNAHKAWSHFCNVDNVDVPNHDTHPMNCVTWEQAKTYCRWSDGDLPTEAQWEYAARGVDGRTYLWGNEKLKRDAPPTFNACDSSCGAIKGLNVTTMFTKNDGWPATAPAGTFPDDKSPFGVLDMAGNVAEWTADYAIEYNKRPGFKSPKIPVVDPKQPESGGEPFVVVRGGAWNTGAMAEVRVFDRGTHRMQRKRDSVPTIGFRCVYEVKQ
jgi:formylglycine-generating enzyme required for sulfatase activity